LDNLAHFSGLERCASIWACAVCTAVIRADRAREIQLVSEAHQAAGGSLVLATFTLRHRILDPLADNLDVALKAWQKMLGGKSWQLFRDRHEIEGYVRAVEITHGANGWHPHIHALFFTKNQVTAQAASEMKDWLFDRWKKLVTDLGARMPSKLRGVDVRPAGKDGKVLAQYLAKVQEEAGQSRTKIGQEMARMDFKDGRHSSRMPFQLLDGKGEDPTRDQMLWIEYVKATKGRRAITWSRGLRERYMPEEPPKTDEEVIRDAERQRPVVMMPGESWDRRLRDQPAVIAAVLEATERGDVSLAVTLTGGTFVEEWTAPKRVLPLTDEERERMWERRRAADQRNTEEEQKRSA
jgi:hypothetical protein